MAELGTAYVNIFPKAPGIKTALEDILGDNMPNTDRPGKSWGKSLLNSIKGVVSAAAVGKLIGDAFRAGGDLQQSFGGLDTLYGEAAAGAKEYAMAAAQAGISANSYAEQAVSFGAALKKAYGGDTAAAMEAANTAILDMADNAAKLGTPIESIQQTYQGFAKQNYTMLDNLKLGYGGTKEEMQRLLADAQALSGVEYDIENLGAVYDAIHVIQEDLGLTGVAAEEAKTTLTGSFNAVKASWTNTLAALTTGEGLEAAMANLSESVGYFGANLLDMLGMLAQQLPAFVSGIAAAIQANAPALMAGAMEIGVQLLNGLIAAIPGVISFVPVLFSALVDAVANLDLSFIGPDLIGQLLASITEASSVLTDFFIQLLQSAILILNQLAPQIPAILEGIVVAIQANAPALIAGAVEMAAQLLVGLLESIPMIIEFVPAFYSAVWEALSALDWWGIGKDIVSGIINGIMAAGSMLLESLLSLFNTAIEGVKAFLGIASPSKRFAREIGHWIPPGIGVGAEDNIRSLDAPLNRVASHGLSVMRRATAPGMTVVGTSALDLDRLLDYEEARPVEVTVVLQGDAKEVFKVVKTYNAVRTKATSYNALAARR